MRYRAALAFSAVCLMGLIAGSAAGMEWGTDSAGWAVMFTFMMATAFAGMAQDLLRSK